MLETIDISNIKTLNLLKSVDKNDFFHCLRLNRFKNEMSLKSNVDSFESLYENNDNLKTFKNKLEDIKKDMSNLSASFITKEEINKDYSTKESVEGKMQLVLTRDKLIKKLQKFTNSYKINEKTRLCREEAHKAAEEMTQEVLESVGTIDSGEMEGAGIGEALGTILATLNGLLEQIHALDHTFLGIKYKHWDQLANALGISTLGNIVAGPLGGILGAAWGWHKRPITHALHHIF